MRMGIILWLVPLALMGCANNDNEADMPLSPSVGDAGLVVSARMVEGSPTWDAVVKFNNEGADTAKLKMGGCSVQTHFLETPGGRVVWGGYPPFVGCELRLWAYEIAPDDSLLLTTSGPPYNIRQQMAGREYYVRVRVIPEDPAGQVDLDVGWVLLQ